MSVPRPVTGWRVGTAVLAGLLAVGPTAFVVLGLVLLLTGQDELAQNALSLGVAVVTALLMWATLWLMVRPHRGALLVVAIALALLALACAAWGLSMVVDEARNPPLKGGGFETFVGAVLIGTGVLVALTALGAWTVRRRSGGPRPVAPGGGDAVG